MIVALWLVGAQRNHFLANLSQLWHSLPNKVVNSSNQNLLSFLFRIYNSVFSFYLCVTFSSVDSDLYWVFGLIAIRFPIGALNQLIIIMIIYLVAIFTLYLPQKANMEIFWMPAEFVSYEQTVTLSEVPIFLYSIVGIIRIKFEKLYLKAYLPC